MSANWQRKFLITSLTLNFVFLLTAGIIVWKKGGIAYLKHVLAGGDTWALKKRDLEVLSRKALPGSTVMLGDSITADGEWAELFHRGDVLNRGIGGDTTDRVLARLDSIIALKPRRVFLMIGINNLKEKSSEARLPRDYERIVRRIRTESPETMLYVESILPVNNELQRAGIDDKNRISINASLQHIATRSGSTFVDLTPAFGNRLDPAYTDDGLHLNANGYLVLKAYLEKYLPDPLPDGDRGK